MIKAITFDLDGVYFPNGKANFIKSLEEQGVSESEAKRVFLKSDQMNNLYKIGEMSDVEFWTWAAREWKINKTPKELIDLLVGAYDVDPNVVEAVRKVRKNGYKTLICSSNFPARINGLQEKFGFLNDFDVVVCSYEVGVNKPSEHIFRELIKRSAVRAEEIVLADDHQENIDGAKNVGITTFLYDGFGKFIEDLRKSGVNI